MSQGVIEQVAVGRRKCASARVRLAPGTGKFTVNGLPIADYLNREVLVMLANSPFDQTGNVDKFDVRALCTGGGKSGQADALRLGVARALVKFNADLSGPLHKAGMMTRDSREVERKKYGRPGARKRFQFSKR